MIVIFQVALLSRFMKGPRCLGLSINNKSDDVKIQIVYLNVHLDILHLFATINTTEIHVINPY